MFDAVDYVKHFDICGVTTKQVACIELHGKPNAATVGAVGVLGVDIDSPFHEVYKCVGVNGSIYSWELLSSGLSIMSSTILGGGVKSVQFPYENLLTPNTYVIKIGDLILDGEGYLYQINALNVTYCEASYTGVQIALYGKSAYDSAVALGFEGSEEEWIASLKGDPGKEGEQGEPGETPYVGSNRNWWVGDIDTGIKAAARDGCLIANGSYVGTGTDAVELHFDFEPRLIILMPLLAIFAKDCGSVGFKEDRYTTTGLDGFYYVGKISGISATFSDNSVSLTGYNDAGSTYKYIAFGGGGGESFISGDEVSY